MENMNGTTLKTGVSYYQVIFLINEDMLEWFELKRENAVKMTENNY